MTVVPAEHLMSLICDNCGDTVTGPASALPDAEVVWTFVFGHGWTGSAFAGGPHHCPRCGLAVRSDSDVGRGAGPEDTLGVDDEKVRRVPDPTEMIRRALAASVTIGGQVLLDLTEVHTIDSVGLGMLVRAHQEARRGGRVLCLVSPSRFVLTVLHTMRLEGVFPVFPTRTAALRAQVDPVVVPTQADPVVAPESPGDVPPGRMQEVAR